MGAKAEPDMYRKRREAYEAERVREEDRALHGAGLGMPWCSIWDPPRWECKVKQNVSKAEVWQPFPRETRWTRWGR